MTRFFIVGCWNNDNCEGDRLDYRKAVFNKIAKSASKYAFGVIAGDNIYSHTILTNESGSHGAKKKKVYYQHTLQFAKDALSKFDIPLLGTIGNHDVANQRVLAEQLAIPSRGFAAQPYSENARNNHNHARVVSFLGPANCYTQRITPNVRLIFIDTNLLGMEVPKIYAETKYRYPSVQDYLQYRHPGGVLAWLQDQLRMKTRGKAWTIVVGHEPIISIKEKAGKMKIGNLAVYKELLHMLGAHSRTLYMCADVHSFQAWNIEWNGKNVPMVVVGTGGASPDDPPLSKDKRYAIEEHPLELVTSKSPFGYCEVSATQDTLRITYVPLGCGKRKVILDFNAETNTLHKTNIKGTRTSNSARSCSKDIIDPIDPNYCTKSEVLQGGRRIS